MVVFGLDLTFTHVRQTNSLNRGGERLDWSVTLVETEYFLEQRSRDCGGIVAELRPCVSGRVLMRVRETGEGEGEGWTEASLTRWPEDILWIAGICFVACSARWWVCPVYLAMFLRQQVWPDRLIDLPRARLRFLRKAIGGCRSRHCEQAKGERRKADWIAVD